MLRYADKNSGPWRETAGIWSNRKFLPDYGDGAAIALACEHADAWLRRLIAAEEAILGWAEAMAEEDDLSVESDAKLDAAASRLLALATRIRAGREKGAQP